MLWVLVLVQGTRFWVWLEEKPKRTVVFKGAFLYHYSWEPVGSDRWAPIAKRLS